MDRITTRDKIIGVLSIDYDCDQADLLRPRTIVKESRLCVGRRRFLLRDQNLSIVTIGNGVVVSCDASRLEWMQQHLGPMNRDEVFSPAAVSMLSSFLEDEGQSLAGPDLKYACANSTFRDAQIPEGICVDTLCGDKVHALYEFLGFDHALQYRQETERPDVFASVARQDGEVVGIAGASADCDFMWQVGIDIIDSLRNCGVGKALLSQLTRAILDTGIIPYYSTASSNIASRALAVSVGYWPAWVEMYAR